MKTINQTLHPSDFSAFGNTTMMMEKAMRNMNKLMSDNTPIAVMYEPVEYTSDNGHVWECQHLETTRDYVPLNFDDSEVRTICTNCGAQLIGEEWINE